MEVSVQMVAAAATEEEAVAVMVDVVVEGKKAGIRRVGRRTIDKEKNNKQREER